MFEIKYSDLAGRIGIIHSNHGKVETPAFVPVIHPVKQSISAKKMRDMGFDLVITNAYITMKRHGDIARKKGIHKIINYDGCVMTDSGGYQVLEYGDVDVKPDEMAHFEMDIMTDFAIPADQNLVNSRAAIAVDGIVPADFTVGAVTTVTDNVVTGYWNASNTQIQVVVPVDNDASLEGGTIQVLGKTSSTSFASLGAAHTITNSDLNSDVTITIDASGTANTDVEEINGFAEGETISVSATITDNFGNATTGTTSSTALLIDQTAPSSSTITNLITDVTTTTHTSVKLCYIPNFCFFSIDHDVNM